MEPSEHSQNAGQAEELVTESLVEEISIDGMCGVY
ncbi:MAG: mycofactocin precursor MftA [Actinomycetia bacterium]|nr:mycofactocin precursor MftA [Actinomycetes bacterium]